MNISSPDKSNRFVFIYNRFKCRQNGCKTASQVVPETLDFEMFYDSYEELRNLLEVKLKTIFNDTDPELSFSKRKWLSKLFDSINKIDSTKNGESFIVKLINCSGIILKGFSKIFFEGHEYFFFNNKVYKFIANEKIFIHKVENDHEVIWERKILPEQHGGKYHKHPYTPRPPIRTFAEFCEHFGEPNKKRKKR